MEELKSQQNKKPDFSEKEKDKIWLSEQKSLRKLVGILGMLLPLLLYLFLYLVSGYGKPLESVSHYYFTRSSVIFAIILSLLAIFLLLYKGKEPIDLIISSLAGIFALCVLIFPTTNLAGQCCDEQTGYSITFLKEAGNVRSTFHFISAGIFLACLAYMSLFLFTKSDKTVSNRSRKKKIRNRIYRVCGVLMILAILVVVAPASIIDPVFYKNNHLTFWMETLAVESFGFSWLVKGEFILED
jgi:phosphoglycerol transferase MdoB-like AlkP superfamily enzyme